jgi:hypothetical protein
MARLIDVRIFEFDDEGQDRLANPRPRKVQGSDDAAWVLRTCSAAVFTNARG